MPHSSSGADAISAWLDFWPSDRERVQQSLPAPLGHIDVVLDEHLLVLLSVRRQQPGRMSPGWRVSPEGSPTRPRPSPFEPGTRMTIARNGTRGARGARV